MSRLVGGGVRSSEVRLVQAVAERCGGDWKGTELSGGHGNARQEEVRQGEAW
jgi:hypothetical protein